MLEHGALIVVEHGDIDVTLFARLPAESPVDGPTTGREPWGIQAVQDIPPQEAFEAIKPPRRCHRRRRPP